MAVIHDTTMDPTKLDLLATWLPQQPWFDGPADGLARAGGFRLDDPSGVLGTRWIYDGERDPVLVRQLAELVRGAATPQAQSRSNTADDSVLVGVQPEATEVPLRRRLTEEDGPPSPGCVSVPWRRPDGTTARGVVAG